MYGCCSNRFWVISHKAFYFKQTKRHIFKCKYQPCFLYYNQFEPMKQTTTIISLNHSATHFLFPFGKKLDEKQIANLWRAVSPYVQLSFCTVAALSVSYVLHYISFYVFLGLIMVNIYIFKFNMYLWFYIWKCICVYMQAIFFVNITFRPSVLIIIMAR